MISVFLNSISFLFYSNYSSLFYRILIVPLSVLKGVVCRQIHILFQLLCVNLIYYMCVLIFQVIAVAIFDESYRILLYSLQGVENTQIRRKCAELYHADDLLCNSSRFQSY